MAKEEIRKLPLGCNGILFICHLCLQVYHKQEELDEHIESTHSLEELNKYIAVVFCLVPALKDELEKYRQLIQKGSEKNEKRKQ